MEFKEFKEEILKRAKEKEACSDEYKAAYKSVDFSELFLVISDNFNWVCEEKVIDIPLLEKLNEDILTENRFYINKSSNNGFIMADSATVSAWDSATVRASGSATVSAWGSATVSASDSATVRASDSATVSASDSATVSAWGSATVRASGSATVSAWGSATVRAWGSAYIDAKNDNIEHKISDRVILRYYYSNKIFFGGDIKINQEQ